MSSTVKMKLNVPNDVTRVTQKLIDNGFQAYLVGGCVRDLLLGKTPKDWDVTTNAKPEEIQDCFEHTFYENNFGTVGVVNDQLSEKIQVLHEKQKVSKSSEHKSKIQSEINQIKPLSIIEVTPYRTESNYSDGRRPNKIRFSQNLDEDLKRRDFTVNALAYNPITEELIDIFGGISDLQNQLLKTVGVPKQRFAEDGLRIMRAIRIACEHDLTITKETQEAIIDNVSLLSKVSRERIRDEFVRILQSKEPMKAILLAKDLHVLRYISKDLERGVGIKQNGAHRYDVFEHLLRTMQHGADREWSLVIRLAGLFHDVSKPETRRWNKQKNDWTFYGHEVVGARVTKKALEDLKFSNEIVTRVTTLVRWHMFFSDPDQITLSAVRRIIRNVGPDNVWDLIRLRICDRIGMGRPKEKSYRLRQYTAMMDEAMRSPISVKDLKINGDEIIKMFDVKPGPRIGWILNALMAITLFDPEKNNKEFLVKQVREYLKLPEEELIMMAEKGKGEISKAEAEEIKKIHRKHRIR